MPSIKLFELGPTRSARCRWTLHEAGLEYESLGNAAEIIGSDELRKIHPLGKLPAALIDGRPLFESAAISTAIADLVPERGLVGRSGTWARALHDQWVCFALTEMEAYVWSNARNTFVLPEKERVKALFKQNNQAYIHAAKVLDRVLEDKEYLVGDRFSVTDILVGFVLNWGNGMGLLDKTPNLQKYLERLKARPHCTL